MLRVTVHIERAEFSPFVIGPVFYNEGQPLGIPRLALLIYDDKLEEREDELRDQLG